MEKSVQDRIAKVAYELYEKRGRRNGHQDEDWLEAERLVKAQIAREGSMEKARGTRAAAQKVAARKTAAEDTKKRLTKPAAKAPLHKGKKISPEAALR